MSGFSADWLSLREPFDQAARNKRLIRRLRDHFANQPIAITDLASGTGSTLRALKNDLHPDCEWHLTDHDETLLSVARRSAPGLRMSAVDLRDIKSADLGAPDLITTSAFLDLVSSTWIDDLISVLERQNVPFYAALSYDGRMAFEPAHAFDENVRQLVNNHQRTDKGFGHALGPDAAQALGDRLKMMGWTVETGTSDWVIEADGQSLALPLIEGWRDAALEMAPNRRAAIEEWSLYRLAASGQADAQITVGHLDLLATHEVRRGN